jgi:DNA-binding Lrp family transcriptional regulator
MARGNKVTTQKIYDIFKALQNDTSLTFVSAAERFGIDPSTIYRIVKNYMLLNGHIWKKIT